MAMNYPRLLETATRQIEENGGDVVLTIKGEQVYDPATGGMTGGDTPVTVKAIVEPYYRSEQLVPDSVTFAKAQKLTIAGAVDAVTTDTATVGSDTYTIQSKSEIGPNIETVVLTELVVTL